MTKGDQPMKTRTDPGARDASAVCAGLVPGETS
jgi:hypothetical protein